MNVDVNTPNSPPGSTGPKGRADRTDPSEPRRPSDPGDPVDSTDMSESPAARVPAGPPPDSRLRRHPARWAAVAVLVIGAGLIAVLATRPSATTVEAKSPLLGRMAPPVGGRTVDGTVFHLSRVPGHYVVLNFFASWCTPCQVETPDLVAFQFQHRPTGDASVVSVVFNDTTDAARQYQAKVGVTWPTLADVNDALALAYGVRENPTSYVIAPNGRVVASILGGATAGGLDQIIARAEASGYGT